MTDIEALRAEVAELRKQVEALTSFAGYPGVDPSGHTRIPAGYWPGSPFPPPVTCEIGHADPIPSFLWQWGPAAPHAAVR